MKTERAEFHVRGQPLDGEPLHYTASGLDYVYLLNGFTVEEDADYGRMVTIEEVDDLHRALGLRIIEQKRSMTNAEFKFLRKQMSLTQKQLADQLGVDVQTVANYEKDKTIRTQSERFMRFLFLLWIMPSDARASTMKKIMETVQNRSAKLKPISMGHASPPVSLDTSIVKEWQIAVTREPKIQHV